MSNNSRKEAQKLRQQMKESIGKERCSQVMTQTKATSSKHGWTC